MEKLLANRRNYLLLIILMVIGITIIPLALHFAQIQRPWSIVLTCYAIIATVVYAWDVSRIRRNVEDNLSGSIHPIIQPGLYTGLGWIIALSALASFVRGTTTFETMHESARMSFFLDGVMATVMLLTMAKAYFDEQRS